MLGIGIYRLEFADNPIKVVIFIFGIDFTLFTEVDGSDPFVFDFFEGRFDSHELCEFEEHVPEDLELAVHVIVTGGFGDVW